MAHLETPDELADTLADWLGYYGAHVDSGELCPKDCRICLTTDLTRRIRASVANERLLDSRDNAPPGDAP